MRQQAKIEACLIANKALNVETDLSTAAGSAESFSPCSKRLRIPCHLQRAGVVAIPHFVCTCSCLAFSLGVMSRNRMASRHFCLNHKYATALSCYSLSPNFITFAIYNPMSVISCWNWRSFFMFFFVSKMVLFLMPYCSATVAVEVVSIIFEISTLS